jgi:hypothetical protein
MAIDNLNYMSSWLPAGQQTDRYSSQPWCLKSKNLDIFSSSKSVKATAWSEPVSESTTWIVLVDQTWNLILRNNDTVYDRSSWSEVQVISWIASNFPSYQICYDWKLWTYNNAQWGTPRQLISKYENGVLKSFTIFTDRSRFSFSSVEYRTPLEDEHWTSSTWTYSEGSQVWKKNSSNRVTTIKLQLANVRWFSNTVLYAGAWNSNYETQWTLQIEYLYLDTYKYWYNAETDQIERSYSDNTINLPITDQLDVPNNKTAVNNIPIIPDTWEVSITVWLKVIPPEWSSDYTWTSWDVDLWVGNYDYYYNYLPVNDTRELKPVWEYYWEKWVSFQPLYNWEEMWENNDNRARVVIYSLDKYMWWVSDVNMDVIWMIVWNEQVYMIGNMDWNWYIIPCDLAWGRWTPYIAYGCTFRWATNIDYLMYLVWEDRGISTLWAYNGQELVQVIWGNKEKDTSDVVDNDEQYKFDWKIVNWRKNLILTTEDNRLFQYGQTYGGKWWAFIHQLPSNAVIKSLKTNWNNLEVDYSITESWTTTNYSIIYQDDVAIKNYNTEWEAVYPIVLWNHLLEKEESDLYVSYILPSSNTSLEFWASANHYHFWTFKVAHSIPTPTVWSTWGISWDVADSNLEFIERNWDYLTFKLIWALPVMTSYVDGNLFAFRKPTPVYIPYTEVNHFRKIWEITANKFEEWEFRFHNLNNKLELPKSHSLQIMVKGKGTANYTPELFSLDLVANQRERW